MPRHIVRPFRPAWWLPGAHLQTIGGRYLRGARRQPLMRERLETPDGDFLDLDHFPVPGLGPDAPLAVVLHGLEGCSRSGYVVHTLRRLAHHGVRGVALNFRSCSGEPNRAPRFYHAGDTDDIAFVVDTLTRRLPGVAIGAVGFSLGGNVLLKYLGERGEASPLRSAAAISVPYDLLAGAGKLERGMGRLYTRYFLRRLRQKSAQKRALLAPHCDPDGAIRARSLREFDDAATAPLHGFRDAQHYYTESSAAHFIEAIRVPTLLLHSIDDPFLPTSAVPRRRMAANPCLVDGVTTAGGHVGFVGGPPWAPHFWAEEEAARFLAAQLLGETAAAVPDAAGDARRPSHSRR